MSSQVKKALRRAARTAVGLGLMALFLSMWAPGALAQSPIQISFGPLAIELAGERGQTVPFSVNIVNNSRFQTARFRVVCHGPEGGAAGRLRAQDAR